MRYFIILLFLINSNLNFSQNEEYSINILANTSVAGKKFEIKIVKEKTQAKIILSQLDSTSKRSVEDNSKMDSIRTEILRNDRRIPNDIYDIVDSIKRKYEHYSRDSIIIDRSSPIINIINSVYQASNEELENHKGHGLDGTTVIVDIRDNVSFRRIGAWSPGEDSNTLIYNLMTGILGYYRTQNPKILKTKIETTGY